MTTKSKRVVDTKISQSALHIFDSPSIAPSQGFTIQAKRINQIEGMNKVYYKETLRSRGIGDVISLFNTPGGRARFANNPARFALGSYRKT